MNRYLLLSLTALLSSGASAAPVRSAVILVGNSLTYGYTFDATPTSERLAVLLGVPVTAMGVGSDVATNISARYTRYALPFPYATAVWEGCTNDFGINSATGAACWATTQAWVLAVEAAGTRAVVLSVFVRGGSGGWSGPKETQRLAYNVLAAAYAVSHPSMVYVNLETTLGDGASPPALKVICNWGDDLHITGTCMQLVAQEIANALNN